MLTFFQSLDLLHTQAKSYLSAYDYPWEGLAGLKEFLRGFGTTLPSQEYDELDHGVRVHKTARVAPTACLLPPCIVGANTEIRHGAYLRGGVLVGENCVVGNSTEIKNSILFDGAKAPHFNYVGDSILGFNAHLGAGCVLSNVKSDRSSITVRKGEESLQTGLQKLGAIVGDYAEIGCNSVLNPGSVVGKRATVYPLSSVRGFVPENCIWKNGVIERKRGYQV